MCIIMQAVVLQLKIRPVAAILFLLSILLATTVQQNKSDNCASLSAGGNCQCHCQFSAVKSLLN